MRSTIQLYFYPAILWANNSNKILLHELLHQNFLHYFLKHELINKNYTKGKIRLNHFEIILIKALKKMRFITEVKLTFMITNYISRSININKLKT